jgi:hypothetical protein
MKKLILIFLPWFLVAISAVFIWNQCSDTDNKEKQIIATHNMIMDKVEAVGKIELVKYYIKDIVEHEEIKNWWPDPKVILIISGEAVGCIDLTKIDSANIKIEKDKVFINLPSPEICYYKINHQESKVHSIEKEYFSQSEFIDKAYKLAEAHLEKAAIKMKIIEHTKTNAEIILRPLLEEVSGKKVVFSY